MRLLADHAGRAVRLTAERRRHIAEHPEMRALLTEIPMTLLEPAGVVQSLSDPAVHLYCRWQPRTQVGAKFMCVVVKTRHDDAFVLTAYLTDTVKKGRRPWPVST